MKAWYTSPRFHWFSSCKSRYEDLFKVRANQKDQVCFPPAQSLPYRQFPRVNLCQLEPWPFLPVSANLLNSWICWIAVPFTEVFSKPNTSIWLGIGHSQKTCEDYVFWHYLQNCKSFNIPHMHAFFFFLGLWWCHLTGRFKRSLTGISKMSFPSPQQANNASLWIGNFDHYLDFFNCMKIELISQNTTSVGYLKSVGLMNIFFHFHNYHKYTQTHK